MKKMKKILAQLILLFRHTKLSRKNQLTQAAQYFKSLSLKVYLAVSMASKTFKKPTFLKTNQKKMQTLSQSQSKEKWQNHAN